MKLCPRIDVCAIHAHTYVKAASAVIPRVIHADAHNLSEHNLRADRSPRPDWLERHSGCSAFNHHRGHTTYWACEGHSPRDRGHDRSGCPQIDPAVPWTVGRGRAEGLEEFQGDQGTQK